MSCLFLHPNKTRSQDIFCLFEDCAKLYNVTYIFTILTTLISYKICNLFTHPKSKVWRKFPHLKIKRLELLPSIRITVKGRVIHFHHWFNFSLLLVVSILINNVVLDFWLTRGFLLGGVIQGLSTPSARKLVYKEEWLKKMLE